MAPLDPRTPESAVNDSDEVLAALGELTRVARENVVGWIGVMERVELVREQRARGVPYTQMQIVSETPSIIDVVSRNQDRLGQAAARLRRAVAHALLDEGLTAAEIARLFGVSRQRVANLLRSSDADGDAMGVDAD